MIGSSWYRNQLVDAGKDWQSISSGKVNANEATRDYTQTNANLVINLGGLKQTVKHLNAAKGSDAGNQAILILETLEEVAKTPIKFFEASIQKGAGENMQKATEQVQHTGKQQNTFQRVPRP